MDINKKKVGIITLFKNNYGSILQCYSTKRYLDSLGFESEVLFEPSRNFGGKFIRLCTILFHSIIYRGYLKNKLQMKSAMKKESGILPVETQKAMNEFVNEEINPVGKSFNELHKEQKNYFRFIVGSDQVWNTSREISSYFFLGFCDRDKRIAFGPSFGTNFIPKFNKRIKGKIKKFKRLSLREETACVMAGEFFSGEILRVGDPTLLLEADEWRKLYKNVSLKTDGKYGFVHFLNEPTDELIEVINEFAIEHDLFLIIFGYPYEKMKNFHNQSVIFGSPLEYLAYIDNADFVFTDSFHTSLFSINLETQFYTFERNYLHNFSQSSRILDMLKRYNLSDHYYPKGVNRLIKNEPISNECLINDRNITRKFLKGELGI